MLPATEKIEGYAKALGGLLKTISTYILIVVAAVFFALWWLERQDRKKYYDDAKAAQQQSIQFLRESRDLVREAAHLYNPEIIFRRYDDSTYYHTSSPVYYRK